MPASSARIAVPVVGFRNTQPTAIIVNTGLNPYSPISISVLSAPRQIGMPTPTIAPASAIDAPRSEVMAMPTRNKMPTMTLSANMTSPTPLVIAVYQASIASCDKLANSVVTTEAAAMSAGITGAGNTGPRENPSKE